MYPSHGGRAPELADKQLPRHLVRFIARMHLCGARKRFEHRPTVDLESYGIASQRYLLDSGNLPDHLHDAYTSPAVQDLWMILSGDPEEQAPQLSSLLHGYCEFRDFNPAELHLIEALRTLRIMYYAAWLARRWEDPAFQQAFPWFNTPCYWEDHVLALREQLALMREPPLRWERDHV